MFEPDRGFSAVRYGKFLRLLNVEGPGVATLPLRESRMPWRRHKCRRFSKAALAFFFDDGISSLTSVVTDS